MVLDSFAAKFMVYCGACILIAALYPIRSLHRRLPQGRVRLSWATLLGLTVFFVAGYLAYAIVFLENKTGPVEIIVPSIFFSGSIFVLLSSILSLRTAIDIRRVTMLERENVTDALTGIFNRRYLDRRLHEEFARAQRYQQPLSILLIDLDNFKTINDTYGHLAGDFALISLTQLILNSIRAADVIARYGGDEFMVIATNTSGPEAFQLAERIRTSAEGHRFDMVDQTKSRHSVPVTTSIGVSCYCDRFETLQSFVDCVDQMMYQAKAEGRNRTALWEDCLFGKNDIEPVAVRYLS